MKQFNISRFQGTSWLLGFIHGTYISQPDPKELANAEAQQSYVEQLTKVRDEIALLELPVSHRHISDELHILQTQHVTCGGFAQMASGIADTLRREMQSRKFFRLDGDTQRYFALADAFGVAVTGAFGCPL